MNIKKQNIVQQAEVSEWGFFELSGIINDQFFAELRMLSFYSQWRRPCTDEFIGLSTESEIKQFNDCVFTVSHYNCYDFALSKLTYGVWYISEIEYSPQPLFTFSLIDETLELSRQINLKRQLSFRMIGRKYPFFLQTTLQNVVIRTVQFAFEYYEEVVNDLPKSLAKRVIRNASKQLDGIDLADELLVKHAATSEVYGQYVAATILFTFYCVADALKANSRYKNAFITPELPLAVVENCSKISFSMEMHLSRIYPSFLVDRRSGIILIYLLHPS